MGHGAHDRGKRWRRSWPARPRKRGRPSPRLRSRRNRAFEIEIDNGEAAFLGTMPPAALAMISGSAPTDLPGARTFFCRIYATAVAAPPIAPRATSAASHALGANEAGPKLLHQAAGKD